MTIDSNYFAQRRDKLRRSLKSAKLPDALLVSDVTNVTYLTGFTGDSSKLLLTPNQAILISDSRFTIQIAEECPDLKAEIRTSKYSADQFTAKIVNANRIQALCVEADDLTKSQFDQLETACDKADLVSTTGLVQDLRAIKDRPEIRKIERAIIVCEKAFSVIRSQMTATQTESEIAFNLEHEIRKFGGTRCSFDPIVGVGPRAALPHAVVTDRKIGESPFVLIDWGAMVNGYVSDLTRILITGKISPKLQRIYGVVLKAQLSAIAKIRHGAKLTDVDSAARKVIHDAGFGKNFGHGLGHGIGLQVHETPYLSQISKGELKAGMVVTVEPGIYLPQWGGVRIEDDILVTRDGHQVLSSVPKKLEECLVDLV
jgi:Xaa-Pro aminopeptidase